jgi:penicillin-binding protein 1B
MDARTLRTQLRRLLTGRFALTAVAVAVGLPLLVLFGAAIHFWSTAASFAEYRPAAPSRLYAAPFELRVGESLDAPTLAAALEALGYRRADGGVLEPGGFRRRGARFAIASRPGEGRGDGLPPLGGATVEVELSRGRVESVRVGTAELTPEQAVHLGRPLLHSYYGEERRECWPVRLEELPEHVVRAVLAAEDVRYYRHSGVAPLGIARAAWQNARAGEVRQGGSTITQQLVKNLYLDPRRTFARKAREAVLAVLLEARFGKDRILEAYLNEIYWGSADGVNLHGLGAAAWAYYGKRAEELELGEAATLAGMIRAPAGHSPLVSPTSARARRDWVLRRMAARRWITRAELATQVGRPVAASPGTRRRQHAPYFAAVAAGEAQRRFGVEDVANAGLRLHSTLSLPDQLVAEEEVAEGLVGLERTWERGRRGLQAALVSLDPASGRIRAWVGGRDWEHSQFDRVGQARRQAGSLFKPVVYAAALDEGRLTPWETVRDTPILVRYDRTTWRPRNSDGSFHGEVTARQALELSLNVPAVRIAMSTGLHRVRALARDMGITSRLPTVPSLALGTSEVTALELAVVYATLASGGRRPTPWALEEVIDAHGEPLPAEPLPEVERVLPEDTAFLVTSMLRGVLDRGTAWSARQLGVRGPLAAKTGTTDDRRDSWFAGYSADRVSVVWVGYDDNSRTRLSGTRGALPLWSRFTARVAPAGGYRAVEAPPGFVTVELDPGTGLLAGPLCPRRVREELPGWRAPLRQCDVHLMPQLLAWAPPPPGPPHEGPGRLSDLLTEASPEAPPVRLRGDVAGLFGEGRRIRIESRRPALEVVTRPGAAPVPVEPRAAVPVEPREPSREPAATAPSSPAVAGAPLAHRQ